MYKSDEFLAFTKGEWLEGLNRFEDNTLDKALLSCRDQWEYPPNLPQFIESCKQHCSRKKGFSTPETVKKGSSEVVEMNLKKIKNILNMKN